LGRRFLIGRTEQDGPSLGKAAASRLDLEGIQSFGNGNLIGSCLEGLKSGSGKATVEKKISSSLASLFSDNFRQCVNGHSRCSQAAGVGPPMQEVKIRRWTDKASMSHKIEQDIAHCLICRFLRLYPLFKEGAKRLQLIGGAGLCVKQIQEIHRRQPQAVRIEHILSESLRCMDKSF
jgi:hypothetical protein